jgi:hypothetical protein
VTPFSLSLILLLVAYTTGLLLAFLINIRIRFSLGTLLIALTCGACAMGLIAWAIGDTNSTREEARVLKIARAAFTTSGNRQAEVEFERPFKHTMAHGR